MTATLSRDTLLSTLLTLTPRNQKWIADHLYENIGQLKKADTVSKEQFLSDLNVALQEVKDIQEGKRKPMTMEELLNEL